jgi:DNA-binding transcriptional LysR family regulator
LRLIGNLPPGEAHRLVALTFLALFRMLRYQRLLAEITSIKGHGTKTAGRVYFILSVLRSDARALSDYLQRWTLLPVDTLPGSLMAEAFRASGLEPPRPTVSTLSFSVHNRLLTAGGFLTIQPGFMSRLPGRHPSVISLPVKLSATRRPIGIISLKNRALSPLCELFLDRVRRIVKPLVQNDD